MVKLSTLQNDVMEIFSPPFGKHEEVWRVRQLAGRLGDRMGLVSTGPPVGPPHGGALQSDLLMEIHCVAVMVEALMEQPTAHPADTHDPGFKLMANEWLHK